MAIVANHEDPIGSIKRNDLRPVLMVLIEDDTVCGLASIRAQSHPAIADNISGGKRFPTCRGHRVRAD